MQRLLIPDPRPLVERLGRDFFQNLPERPGVYLMQDASQTVVYVGKANNLRRRLASYRVANPERLSRRHLRLLHAVARIELEACADEAAALAREAALIRELKPRFNRAGTWPGTPRLLAWNVTEDAVELEVTLEPVPGWNHYGPLTGGAGYLAARLARLLWLALNPAAGVERLPAGWTHGRALARWRVRCAGPDGAAMSEATARLEGLFQGDTPAFCQWIDDRRGALASPFDRAWFEAEFESLAKLGESPPPNPGFGVHALA